MGAPGLRHHRHHADPGPDDAHQPDRLQQRRRRVGQDHLGLLVGGGGDSSKLAADGNAGTRWSSAWSDNQWWQVDLGSSTNVCQVALNWEAAYGKAFQVQVSDSPTSGFTTIATVTNGTGGANQVVAASGKGRYLRLNLQTRATGYGFSLWEVKVSTTGTTPTDPTNPTDPTTPTGDLTNPNVPDGPADGKVKVAGSQGNWALQVNGKQWVVKGMTWGPSVAEFPAHVANLKAMGVNTIRTWGTDAGSKALFDQAAANGIRVIAGFWLAPGGGPGSGGCPDYVNDATYKANSMNDILTQVRAYKDNPGVLMWDVGNESLLGLGSCGTTGGGVEQNRNAYAKFVNDVAVQIKRSTEPPRHVDGRVDGRLAVPQGLHPCARPLRPEQLRRGVLDEADVGQRRLHQALHPHRGRARGSWEADPDVNGIPNQGTDQDNANGYVKSWNCLGEHRGVALGATMFHYGLEGDFGGIWFNVIPGGNKRLAYYAIAKMYGGSAGQSGVNTPPTFQSMSIDNSTSIVAGSTVTLRAAVSDPQGDPINYVTFVNSQPINDAGGLQWVEHQRNGNVFTFTAPQTLGVWKAYLFAEDGKGNVGVQTVSFRVAPPAVNGTNIAKGKTASASSFDPWNGNYTPAQAVDGDYTTRWSSNWTDTEWIQVDLGSKQTFTSLQLVWEAAFAKGYLIQQSDDGNTWSTLRTVTDGDGNVDTHAVNGNARYVRIQGVTRGTAYGYSLYELGVYR